MVRRLYRLAASCCAIAATLALAPHALAATHAWAWGPLTGVGEYQSDPPNGPLTSWTSTNATLTITYDPATTPAGASLTISPGDAPSEIPEITITDLTWVNSVGSITALYGYASDGSGTSVQVLFTGDFGSGTFAGWPASLAGEIGYPVEVNVSRSSVAPLYDYTLHGPAAVMPEPSGVLLMVVGVGGAVVAHRRRSA